MASERDFEHNKGFPEHKWEKILTDRQADIQLKPEVYIGLSQIHLNSVFHNS